MAQGVAQRVIELVVDALDVNALLVRVDLNAVLERVDLNGLLGRVDLNQVIDRVDLNQVIDRVDLNQVIDRVDLNQVIDRVDVNRLMARVDINELAGRVDIEALVKNTDLGALLARMGASDLRFCTVTAGHSASLGGLRRRPARRFGAFSSDLIDRGAPASFADLQVIAGLAGSSRISSRYRSGTI